MYADFKCLSSAAHFGGIFGAYKKTCSPCYNNILKLPIQVTLSHLFKAHSSCRITFRTQLKRHQVTETSAEPLEDEPLHYYDEDIVNTRSSRSKSVSIQERVCFICHVSSENDNNQGGLGRCSKDSLFVHNGISKRDTVKLTW